MNTKWEISGRQAGWLLPGAVALNGHALAVTFFLVVGGRDAWMSGLIALPAAVLQIWCLAWLSRTFPGQTLVQYLPRILGYFGHALSVVYLLYYLTVVVFTLRMTTAWLVDTILPETPSYVLATIYIAACVYAAASGLDVIARINDFTLLLLTFLGSLVMIGTTPEKDFRLLMPFLEHGMGPILATAVLCLGYYGEMSILAMFAAFVRPRDRQKLTRNFMYSLLYVSTTLSGPLVGSIATLGYRLAANMPHPTFQHWLMLSITRFFERTDLLAVHQWLVGAYARCGLFLLMAAHGGVQLSGNRLRLPWVLVACGVGVILGAEFFFSVKPIFDQFVLRIYLPGSAVLGWLLPILLAGVARLRGSKPRPQEVKPSA